MSTARLQRFFERPRLHHALLALAVAVLIGPGPAAQEAPRPLSDLHLPIGEVLSAEFSPDGAYLVYLADFELRNEASIYSLPQAGGAGDEVLLGRTPSDHVASPPIFSPDSALVLFRDVEARILAAPIGGGEATILYDAGVDGSVTNPRLADGHVVFSARPDEQTPWQIFSVPLSGGAAVQLSQLPGSGWSVGGLALSDHGRLAYGGAISQPVAIFTVPVTGGTPVQVSHQLAPGQRINGMAFSPDGARLVYRVGTAQTANLYFDDLYSVPSTGGTAVLLHDGYFGGPPIVGHRSLGTDHFFFTADSSQVLFADSSASVTDLYLVGVDGSGKTLLDTQPLIRDYWWFAEASRLFYQWDLPDYSVGVLELGAGPGRELSVHAQGNLSLGSVEIAPDTSRVVYRAVVETGQRLDLYSVPTAGGAPVRLNDTSASQANVRDAMIAGSEVVFDRDSRLVKVPIDGGAETFLSDPFLPLTGDLSDELAYADGSAVAHLASYESYDVIDLFRVPLAGTAVEKLHPPVPEVMGEVRDFVVGAGGEFAAYRADRDERDRFQLYEVRIDDAEGASRVIGPALGPDDDVVAGPQLAAAAGAVIFKVERFGAADEVWATTFGGEPRLLFDLDTVHQYQPVAPGRHVVYIEGTDLFELDVVTGQSRSLESLEVPLHTFTVSPDGTMLILRSNSAHYSLPIAGGVATALGGDTLTAISPDDAWVLLNEGVTDYVLVSSDGSEQRDLGLLGSKIGFSADSRHLLYAPTGELWGYDIEQDTHQRLDPVAPAEHFVDQWWPLEGGDVLVSQTESSSWSRRLIRLPAAGGAATSLLDAELEDRRVSSVYFSPDGTRLVLDVIDEILENSLLYTVPATGGPSTPLTGGFGAKMLGFTSDGRFVLYQSKDLNWAAPLLAEPTTGGPVVPLIPEGFGDVEEELHSGPGDRITLRVERHRERIELYTLELGDFVLFFDGFESGDLSAWSAFTECNRLRE